MYYMIRRQLDGDGAAKSLARPGTAHAIVRCMVDAGLPSSPSVARLTGSDRHSARLAGGRALLQWSACIVVLCASVAISAATPPSVATRMHHVTFHVGKGVALQVDDLIGRLRSRTAAPVVFDDVNAYAVEIDSARVSMTPDSLTNLMNNHVFASADAPISNIKVGIEGDELTQSGTLKKGVPVPFTVRATVAATPDGRIRLHPTAIKAAGFVSKRVLDFFGLELENLMKVKDTNGVAVDGDDLLLDPERLLPPPIVRGRVTRAWIENGALYQQFGGAPPRSAITPPMRVENYMYYRGGTLRFGKLTMHDADLLLVDADPKDAFDFSPEKYNEQLVAGYSKNTRAHGLIVYTPDLSDLSARASAANTAAAGPRHRRRAEGSGSR